MNQQYNNLFAKIKNAVLDILFPLEDLPRNLVLNETLFCGVCRARLPENKKICHKGAQYLLGAAVNYNNESVRRMIWQLKYRNRTGLAFMLARLLTDYIKKTGLDLKNHILVPIPLSKNRLRSRGYNQATLIAKIVSENLKLPVEEAALFRIKDTSAQAELKDWDERQNNIAGCFAASAPLLVDGKNLILIDDVFTSGSTMSEAARVLKEAGAKKILGLVIAKAG